MSGILPTKGVRLRPWVVVCTLALEAAAGFGQTAFEATHLVEVEVDSCLNLRSDPRPLAEVLQCLPPGGRVEGLESLDSWRRVRTPDGMVGWVAADFLAPIDAVEPSRGGFGGRDAAGSGSASPTAALRSELAQTAERAARAEAREAELGSQLAASVASQRELESRMARMEEQKPRRLLQESRRDLESAQTRIVQLEAELESLRETNAELVRQLGRASAESGATDSGSSTRESSRGAGGLPVLVPLAAPDDFEAVRSELDDWAAAWSNSEADRFLAHYSDTFRTTDGASLAVWREQRRAQMEEAAGTQFEVTGLRSLSSRGDSQRVQFELVSLSDAGRSSRTLRFEFLLEKGRWKIVSESGS